MKHFYRLFSILLLFIVSSAYAQSYQWAKSVSGYFHASGNSIVTDNRGYVYVAGVSSYTNNSHGIFITKNDAAGNSIWSFNLEGVLDAGNAIAVDDSGNVYVTGVISIYSATVDFNPGSGLNNLSSNGSDDIFLAKYDSLGNYIWAFNIGGAGEESSNAIAIDALSGNIYVTGYINSDNVDFNPGVGTNMLSSTNGGCIFLAKYNASGSHLWSFNIGGKSPYIGYNEGNSIAIDGLGTIFITGKFVGPNGVDFDPGTGTKKLIGHIGGDGDYPDIFIAKYSSSGNYVWAINMGADYVISGGIYASSGRSLVLDSFDNIYITGYIRGNVDFDPGTGVNKINTNGQYEKYVAKYDSSGNYLWAFSIGGSSSVGFTANHQIGGSIALDQFNSFYITGSFWGGNIDFDPGNNLSYLSSHNPAWSDEDIFIAKYDSAGHYIWAFNMGEGIGDSRGHSIALDTLGNIFITGFFTDTVDFNYGAGINNLNNNSNYYTDLFIAKYGSCNFSATITATDLTCATEPTGSVKVSLGGGSLPYSFSWNTGQTSLAIDSLSGWCCYRLTAIDYKGCVVDTFVSISAPPPLYVYTNVNGSEAEAVVSGGVSPYSYLWSNGDTEAIVSNLSTGDYTVTVTDNNGCTYSAFPNINVNGNIEFAAMNSLRLYAFPNPNNGAFTINIKSSSNAPTHIQIINTLGEIIEEETITNGANKALNISFEKFSAGMYFVTMQQHSLMKSIRIIVE